MAWEGLLTLAHPLPGHGKTPQLKLGTALEAVLVGACRVRETGSHGPPSSSTEQSMQCSSNLGAGPDKLSFGHATHPRRWPHDSCFMQAGQQLPLPRTCETEPGMIAHPPHASPEWSQDHQAIQVAVLLGNQADLPRRWSRRASAACRWQPGRRLARTPPAGATPRR